MMIQFAAPITRRHSTVAGMLPYLQLIFIKLELNFASYLKVDI